MTYKHWIAIALVPVMGAVLIVAIPIMMLLRSGSDASTSCGGPAVMPPAGAEVAPTDPSVLAGKQTEIVRTIIAVGEQMGFSDQASSSRSPPHPKNPDSRTTRTTEPASWQPIKWMSVSH